MKRAITIVVITSLLGLFLTPLAMSTEQAGAGNSVAATADNRAALAGYLNGTTDSPFRQTLRSCFQQLGDREKSLSLPQQPENPELLAMVICSQLLNTAEKQYWLDTLPKMSVGQRQQLQDTLAAEFRKSGDPLQQQLDAINQQLPPAGGSKQ